MTSLFVSSSSLLFRKLVGEAVNANLTFKFLSEQLMLQEIVQNVQDNLLQEFSKFYHFWKSSSHSKIHVFHLTLYHVSISPAN